MRIVKILLLFSFFFGLTLPAAAQQIIRVDTPAVGEIFTVKFKSSSIYAVDPFPYRRGDTPEAEIINRACMSSLNPGSYDAVYAHSFFSTISSGCALQFRFTARGNKTNVMTFVRARKPIKIDVTNEWQQVKLGKGTYTHIGGFGVVARIDMDRSSKGCHTAETRGVYHNQKGIADYLAREKGQLVSVLDGATAWYRILSKSCTMWLRAYDGKTGALTLLKLSGKAIKPPKF